MCIRDRAYCVYSAAISLVVYPICGHWMWGGGWLQKMCIRDRDYPGQIKVNVIRESRAVEYAK